MAARYASIVPTSERITSSSLLRLVIAAVAAGKSAATVELLSIDPACLVESFSVAATAWLFAMHALHGLMLPRAMDPAVEQLDSNY
jgi:hypothetical protein